jgi:methylenetetrahydrofolate dehydrogenase (NADP+)/methenyltetrahydrofolate cyclohydrolase
MTAQIISGTEIAKEIREELTQEIAELKEKHNLIPGLATVLVGEDPASQVYVGQKEKTSQALGVYSERHDLSADTSEQELLALVDKLNKGSKIHGILVQLPLPKHINVTRVLYAIDPKKDVDAFHPVNVGKLMIGEPDYLPCTPYGIYQLLVRSGIDIKGAEVVMVGASNIVGRPAAMLLSLEKEGFGGTVTLCHILTRDISIHTKRADILIVAVGKPKLITADMVKEGVVVIDVGVNRIGKTAEGKAILVGDVDFEAVKEKAKAITPVPGGVGPMTITMLMLNTVKAAKLAAGLA